MAASIGTRDAVVPHKPAPGHTQGATVGPYSNPRGGVDADHVGRVSSRPATSANTAESRRMPKRRFQQGTFRIERNGMAYSFYYADDKQADGTPVTRKARHLIGFVGPGGMSERAARRQHAKIMAAVNDQRGSVAPAVPGKAFCDLVDVWRKDIAPTLSPSTVRQRESYLRRHIIPRFGNDNPQSMNVAALQEFATGLREKLSRKTVINVLSAIFSILDYAEKAGTRTAKVRFGDIRLGKSTVGRRGKFFTKQQAAQIIQLAEEVVPPLVET